MNRTFEHTITRANYLLSHKGNCKNLYGGWRAKALLNMPVFIGLGLLIYVMSASLFDYPIIALFAFVLYFVMVWVWQNKYVPYMSKRLAAKVGIPWQDMRQKIYVDKVGITVIGDHIKTQFEWQAIGRIINAHGNVYFYFGQFCIVLPTSKFENDADIETFIAQCQDYREQAREYDEKE